MLRRIFVLLTTSFLLSCVTSLPVDRFGVQPDYSSFIPARIAVGECRVWPETSQYVGQPKTNLAPSELEAICARFDQYVLDSFKDQPFMRGFSPKAIQKLLEGSEQKDLMKEIPVLWRPTAIDCRHCTTSPTWYKTMMAGQNNWRLWLNQFSKASRNSDALLMPFIVYARDTKENDRGLIVARRAVGVVMFLIDTNNARLVWSGGREAFVSNQVLQDAPNADVQPPPTADVFARLLVEDVWREFPGRLFL